MTFLKAHRDVIAETFFVVPTMCFRLLYDIAGAARACQEPH